MQEILQNLFLVLVLLIKRNCEFENLTMRDGLATNDRDNPQTVPRITFKRKKLGLTILTPPLPSPSKWNVSGCGSEAELLRLK